MYNLFIAVRKGVLDSNTHEFKFLKSAFLMFNESSFDVLDLLILNEMSIYQITFKNDFEFLNKIIQRWPYYEENPKIKITLHELT